MSNSLGGIFLVIKRCTTCKELVERGAFANRKSSLDGLKGSCRPCESAYLKNYAVVNGSSLKDKKRAYYKKNKEHIDSSNMRNYYADREGRLKSSAAWKRNNKDRVNAYCAARRARVAGNGVSMTSDQWVEVRNSWGNKCASCGTSENITLDHIIPIFHGGQHSVENAQPLCKSCNCSKGTKAFSFLRKVS